MTQREVRQEAEPEATANTAPRRQHVADCGLSRVQETGCDDSPLDRRGGRGHCGLIMSRHST